MKDAKEIRRHVGYLPSEVHYYDDMKVIDLLTYSASFYKVSDRRLKQLAERLDLDIYKKLKIYHLEIEKSRYRSGAFT